MATVADEEGSRITVLSASHLPVDGGGNLPVVLVIAMERVSRAVTLSLAELRLVIDALELFAAKDRSGKPLLLTDGEARVRVAYDNRGEPYREGASIAIEFAREECWVFLSGHDLKAFTSKLVQALLV